MTRSTATFAALTLAAVATLTACSAEAASESKPESKPTPSSSSPSAKSSPSSDLPKSRIPPKPTGAARAAYLDAIGKVDRTLIVDADKAIDAGRNQCNALDGGARNVDYFAAQRFGNDAHPLTDAQGKLLNAALRATLCPK
ncbi:DUF732 domain-containing protein [Streptomyces iconiensis]|uniref:DUF732 domain-containing protein n=1 Tax=Streptomyces iconiensis TaxID=1384038 RepID=A0ABT7A6H5_9ACTN|nr:DUF732 domain-containing protein [Streptomyces iconiensis]MDJ1136228.1 DUF732 domain-containing protein [Streptomyces iconiensis]